MSSRGHAAARAWWNALLDDERRAIRETVICLDHEPNDAQIAEAPDLARPHILAAIEDPDLRQRVAAAITALRNRR